MQNGMFDSLLKQVSNSDLVSGGAIFIFNKFIMFVINFLLLAIIGVSGFGKYSYVLVIANMATMVALFGFPLLVTRQVAIYKDTRQYSLIGGLLRFSSLGALGGLLLTVACMLLMGQNKISDGSFDSTAVALLITCLVLTLVLSMLQAWLRGVGKVKKMLIWVMMIGPVFHLGVLVIAFIVDLSLDANSALLAFLTSLLVTISALMFFFLNSLAEMPLSEKLSYDSRRWINSLLPFFLIGGVNMLMQRTDVVMLGAFTSFESVGIYVFSIQIASAVAIMLMVANTLFEPKIAASLNVSDTASCQELFTKITRQISYFSIAIYLLMLFVVTILSWLNIWEVFNQSFIILIAIIGGSHLINNICGPTGTFLSMAGYEKETLKALLIGTGLNVVLNYYLINTIGMIGAAISTILSMLVVNFIFWQKVNLYLGITAGPFGAKIANSK